MTSKRACSWWVDLSNCISMTGWQAWQSWQGTWPHLCHPPWRTITLLLLKRCFAEPCEGFHDVHTLRRGCGRTSAAGQDRCCH